MRRIGRAEYKRGSLYFDQIGWAMVKAVARKHKKSPKYIVTQSIKRYMRKYGKKTENTRD